MICDKHKFIFIHIRKTGGTSIERVFDETAGHGASEVSYKHATAQELKKLMPFKWDSYFKFTIVRNPWDWLVSRYTWSAKTHNYITCNSFKEFTTNICNNIVTGYPDWILDACMPQIDMISIDGKVCVDHIYRFENLQDEFNDLCQTLKLSNIELPQTTKSKHKHYTEYYDDETREIVAEKYAKDIEYFGYKYGE